MNTQIRSMKTGPAGALETASAGWLRSVDHIERTTIVDPAVRVLQRAIRALPLGGARDILRGRPLGHPLHPVLVQVPVGCLLSAGVMDVVPGGQPAVSTLTAVGLAGAGPAAVAGWLDWADLPPREARVGLAHAVSNVAVIACYVLSLKARMRGHTVKGRGWSLAGLTAVAVSGALGGHVAYRRAVGADAVP
ncbi:hypothetical protein OG429_07145 [Streptomyces sp. NBC_00190]|uniref:DUF2231 domain-containing protein n=1 Tax=unclassified Streptomyces TaxID=2593676 RepID=UPI002E2E4045|nr:DUF2231 domain-containing protein [Streptomyces sp. NBC_00190]WSZ39129.1 hypothetical protein OG239_10145 [Streptomyces sp. NBC_00868]